MRRSRLAPIIPAILVCSSIVLLSQETVDLGVIDRIKREAFERSDVMDHLRNLTDVHGPRLTGSPEFEEAATWTVDRLTSFGLSNVHLERWGPFGRAWSIEQYSVEQIAPHYARLTAMPLAWSATSTSTTAAARFAVSTCKATTRCARCSSNGSRRFAISA